MRHLLCGTFLSGLIVLQSGVGLAQRIIPANDGTGTQVNRSGNRYDITGGRQTGRNLFHSFGQFNVDAGNIANFLAVPNLHNILARVTGGSASYINGLIQVTGGNPNLYLMNPAGIVFGQGASLNVPASFIATTADRIMFPGGSFNASGVNDYSKLAGEPIGFAFHRKDPAAIINEGNLSVNPGKSVSLIAGQVINTGTVQAPGGTITLAAVPGENLVRLSQTGQLLSLEFNPQQAAQMMDREGNIPTTRLPELLTGGGVTTVTQNGNGTVRVAGSNLEIPTGTGTAIVSGVLDVSSTSQTGGNVGVFGTQIALAKSEINASGWTGGGEILIGGEFQGKGTQPNAQYTFVSRDSQLTADAVNAGNGGRVIVWADKATDFRGSITAKGGQNAGDGGLVEVSGKESLRFTGNVDTSAPKGKTGTLLLDPKNITVIGASSAPDDNELPTIFSSERPEDSLTISSSALLSQLSTNSVTLQATNDIEFNADLIGSGNFTTLSATAGNNITATGTISLSNIGIDFEAGNSISTGNITARFVELDAGGSISTGNITATSFIDIDANSSVTTGNLTSSQSSVNIRNRNGGIATGDITATSFVDLNANGSVTTGNLISQSSVLVNAGGSVGTGEIVTQSFVDIRSSNGNVTTGDISSQSSTLLNAGRSISTENIIATSFIDIDANSSVTTGNLISQSIVLVNAGGSVGTGEIVTQSSVNIRNRNGGIATGDITATSFIDIDANSSVTTGNLTSSQSSVNIRNRNGGIATGDITATSFIDIDANSSVTTGNLTSSQSSVNIRNRNGGIATGDITATSFVDLNANGSVTTGNLTSGRVVVRNRNGDIELGNVTSAGRVDITSGDFSLNRRIVRVPGTNRTYEDFEPSTYFGFSGNGGNIKVGDVTSTGATSVGTIQINTNGNIKTGNLSNADFSTSGTKRIGVVAGGSIETGFIDARNSGGIGGDAYVISQNSVVRINGIGSTGFSIDASGSAGGGDIIIFYGGSNSFAVGSAAVNGTAGGITNGQFSILPFQQFSSRQLGTVRPGIIRIGPPNGGKNEEAVINQILFGQEFITPNFDLGFNALEDVALTDFVARFDIAEALGTGDFEAILALDTLFTGEFDRFLGVNPINDLNSVEKIGNMLSRLAKETGKRPAIVYLMVDERQLTIAAIPPGSRAGVASAGLVASTEPFAQREAQVQPVVRGIPEAKRANLMPVVERFLTALKDPRQRTSTAYLKDAQQLYQWFIAPIEKELQAQGIDTLLFSMDNGLRLLPVAALHDGQQFLVEKYSTALIPSVNLIDTRYRNLRDGRVLAMGADTFANQAPLPAVPVELKVITEEWPGQSFLNQEFTVQRLTQERLQGGYPIIHLATHADFAPGRITNSYIEFGNNQRLNLPQVRELPLREPNVVELLTLSACRTSVGDVSAELGFAGLAVQSGVKSALASLWYVSDEGTLALMSEFYKNLRQAPIKAEALRQAQIAMLQGKVTIKGGELRGVRGGIPVPSAIAQRGDQVLNHPYYWAAFTLIGSPW